MTDSLAVIAIEARNAYLEQHPGAAVPAMRAAIDAALEASEAVDKLRGYCVDPSDPASFMPEHTTPQAAPAPPVAGEVERFKPEIVADPAKPYIHFRHEDAGDWMLHRDHARMVAEKDAEIVRLREVIDSLGAAK